MHAQAGLKGVGRQGGGKVGWGRGAQLADDPNPARAKRPSQTGPGIHFIPAMPPAFNSLARTVALYNT